MTHMKVPNLTSNIVRDNFISYRYKWLDLYSTSKLVLNIHIFLKSYQIIQNFHYDKGHELSCDASLFWNPLANGVIVQGRKQGCIKKHYGTTKAQSQLCRKAIAVAFKRKFEKDFEGIKTYQGLKAKCRQSSDLYLPLYDVLNEKFKLNNSERKEKDEFSLIS